MNTIKLNTRNTKMNTETIKMVNGKLVVALGLCAALLAPASLFAAFSDKAVGTRAGQFLKLPVGARAIGMGEAHTAIADDANAIYYNVAGIAKLEKKSAEYMYSSFMIKDKVDGESNPGQHWVGYAMPISETIGAAGIGIQYYNAGDINETDISAKKVGTFSPSDLAVNLAYARKVFGPANSAGLNVKIVNSKIKESATAVAFDLGAQSSALMEGKLMLGFAVQNIGGKLKFETEESKLPILIKLGSGYQVTENWVAALDIIFPEDNSPQFALGTDYKHMINEEMSLSGRVGYNSRSSKVDGFNGVTVGAGFGFKIASLDIAWMPLGDLGSTFRMSLGVKF